MVTCKLTRWANHQNLQKILRTSFIEEKDLLEEWVNKNQRARFEELKDHFQDGAVEEYTNSPPKHKKSRKKKQYKGTDF